MNSESVDTKQAQILLARQAIYDKYGAIYAYELLYRDNGEQSNIDNSNESTGTKATSSVIAQLFTNMDIDAVIGTKRAFINFTYTDIIHQIPRLLPKERIVIEVLETVVIDEPLIESLLVLSKEGYQIALDDFIYKPEAEPLLEIANIIKLDVLTQSKLDILEQLNTLKSFKGKFLAEKIDNKIQFNDCVALGFDYFQGFFLNKPDALKGQVITENTALILKVLTELNKDDVSLKNLEKSILEIPKLSYRILRVSNSAYYYAGKKINTLPEAIFRIGISKIINWANLILLASNPETSTDLIQRTLIRAHMCESIAKMMKDINADEAYTVGMFSTLDGMLNEPLPLLLSKIHLDESLSKALLNFEGKLGIILKSVIDYEQANFATLKNLSMDSNVYLKFYLEGIKYANSTLSIFD